jgi:uroporphyrinogen-III decarboxylase
MNRKQQMLATLEGKPTDRIPWVPRLDLWYRANQRADTLPDRYRRATLVEMVDDLGWGYHGVVPDFQDLRSPEDDVHRALGTFSLHRMPVHTALEGIDYRMTKAGDRTTVEYRTPVGTLTTVTVYDDRMRAAGITISHVERYAFRGPEDYAPLEYVFRHARAVPNYDGYAAEAERIGDRGFVVAYVHAAASPMHFLQRDVMPLETFFFELHDRPDEVRSLADAISGYWQQMLTASAKCPAEVFLLGANYDSAIQYPRFFAEHIGPGLAKVAAVLHRQGKYLLTHTDGENRGLLEHYVASNFDIADSVCPAPMTRLTIGQVREAFDGRITIMGGIPSVTLVRDSMTDPQFEKYLDEFFSQIGRGDHLLLGVSDTTPPAAEFGRLMAIAKRVEKFGPVR